MLATAAIHAPGACVILDPKGDRDLLVRCAREARNAHKPFAMLTPALPDRSARINMLGTATTPAEVSARIRALMPSGGARGSDPFFEEYPLALIERLATVQALLGQPWTLEGLYSVSVLRGRLEHLVRDYLTHLYRRRPHPGPKDPPVARIQKLDDWIGVYRTYCPPELTADALIDDLEKPRDHFTKVTSNLVPAFRGVVGNPYGPLFSQVNATLTWPHIAQQQTVVYVALASMLLGDIANRIGRVILQDLVGYLGRRYAYEDLTTAPPITVFIDELGDVVYPLFINALNKGRGAQARFILAQQSLADPEAAMGPAQARRIFDNLNTRVWFRLADDRTAAEAVEGLGTCTVHLPETGVGLSYGGTGGLSGSSQRRLTAKETPLIRPTWLTALPRGEAFARLKGELWKLQVPLLTPLTAPEVADLGLMDLWQGLDPAPRKDRDALPPGPTVPALEAGEPVRLPPAPTPLSMPPADELLCDGDKGGGGSPHPVRAGEDDLP